MKKVILVGLLVVGTSLIADRDAALDGLIADEAKKEAVVKASEKKLSSLKFVRDDSKNIVIDNTNKLMWQDNEIPKNMTLVDAAKYCKNLDLGGYTDWLVPYFNDYTSTLKKKEIFKHTAFGNTGYWSSSPLEGMEGMYYAFYYKDGYKQMDGKYAKKSVRCIREAQ